MFEKYSSPHHGVGTIVDVSIDNHNGLIKRKFQAGSIESSNTDVSNELTNMIKAQQLFSGASRLLQAEVEMVRSVMK